MVYQAKEKISVDCELYDAAWSWDFAVNFIVTGRLPVVNME